MRTALAAQLSFLYARKVFPVLAWNDPEYQRALLNAGLGWVGEQIPPERRAQFEEVMNVRASLGAAEIADAKSLDPSGACCENSGSLVARQSLLNPKSADLLLEPGLCHRTAPA